uniref:Triabin n=1 Tax=Triatoma dimidiata TaxID=72491 RepID=D1MWD6_TRIDM|nr:hypothetical protein Td33 similar to pallidipin-like salivary lipocalin [Triatoma dimidiata]
MKTIIAVTFIGILTYAFAEEASTNPKCNYQAMANFDLTRYLQIAPLYSTYVKDAKYFNFCRVYKSNTKSDDTINTNIWGYYENSEKNYYYEIVCSTKEESFKTGQYWTECNVVKDTYSTGIRKTYQVYMSVIDTDYQNYAILYNCISNVTHITDNIEVLQKDPGTADNLVKAALEKKQMKLEEFFLRNFTTVCQNGNEEKKET